MCSAPFLWAPSADWEWESQSLGPPHTHRTGYWCAGREVWGDDISCGHLRGGVNLTMMQMRVLSVHSMVPSTGVPGASVAQIACNVPGAVVAQIACNLPGALIAQTACNVPGADVAQIACNVPGALVAQIACNIPGAVVAHVAFLCMRNLHMSSDTVKSNTVLTREPAVSYRAQGRSSCRTGCSCGHLRL